MWCCILASLLATDVPVATDLAPPVQLRAGGHPINVDMGHAAPFVADLKGDAGGTVRPRQASALSHIGTWRAPNFDRFEWFQAGGRVVSLPAG
jgi:hypothetical protein